MPLEYWSSRCEPRAAYLSLKSWHVTRLVELTGMRMRYQVTRADRKGHARTASGRVTGSLASDGSRAVDADIGAGTSTTTRSTGSFGLGGSATSSIRLIHDARLRTDRPWSAPRRAARLTPSTTTATRANIQLAQPGRCCGSQRDRRLPRSLREGGRRIGRPHRATSERSCSTQLRVRGCLSAGVAGQAMRRNYGS